MGYALLQAELHGEQGIERGALCPGLIYGTQGDSVNKSVGKGAELAACKDTSQSSSVAAPLPRVVLRRASISRVARAAAAAAAHSQQAALRQRAPR